MELQKKWSFQLPVCLHIVCMSFSYYDNITNYVTVIQSIVIFSERFNLNC